MIPPDYVRDVLKEKDKVRLEEIRFRPSGTLGPFDPILIAVIKDEIDLLPDFLRHYRLLGIKRFVFIDNDSKDGTLSFLQKQFDVDLFLKKGAFTWVLKQGWINKIISLYGYNRWYVYVDADEQIVFDGMEGRWLSDLARTLSRKGIRRVRGFLLDMYQKGPVLKYSYDARAKLSTNFPYCDGLASYGPERRFKEIWSFKGGPRMRAFSTPSEPFRPEMSKYPLFHIREGEVMANPHHLWPYEDNFICTKRYLALLHFKFLPRFMARVKRAVEEKTYWDNSAEYRKYLEHLTRDENFGFFDERVSRLYTSPADLRQEGLIHGVEWASEASVERAFKSAWSERRMELLG